jgi:hypothetical protein
MSSCPSCEFLCTCCPTKKVPLLTSQTADRSQSGRVRRLKGKVNSAFYSANPTATRGQSLDPSVLLSIVEGSRTIYTYDHQGDIRTKDDGCCAAAFFNPVFTTVPSPPTNVTAVNGGGTATISWTTPASDGGSPILFYTVTSDPDGIDISGSDSPSCNHGSHRW